MYIEAGVVTFAIVLSLTFTGSSIAYFLTSKGKKYRWVYLGITIIMVISPVVSVTIQKPILSVVVFAICSIVSIVLLVIKRKLSNKL